MEFRVASVFLTLLVAVSLKSSAAQSATSTILNNPMMTSSSPSISPIMTSTSPSLSLYCYQCNSLPGFNGSNCVNNDAASLAPYLSKCPINIYRNYTRCRKMIQSINGVSATIRQCASAGKFGDGSGPCSTQQGTSGVTITYCECNQTLSAAQPSTACNHAPTSRVTSPVTALVTSLLLGFVIGSSLYWHDV
jgi:hypothetical protein